MSVTAKPYCESTSQPSKSEITRARHTCNLSASVICKYNKLVYFTNLIVKCFDVVIFDALILFFFTISFSQTCWDVRRRVPVLREVRGTAAQVVPVWSRLLRREAWGSSECIDYLPWNKMHCFWKDTDQPLVWSDSELIHEDLYFNL